MNAEIEKIIGDQRRRDGSIQFLVLWEGYLAEDATYRDVELFKTSPYGIKVVEDYLATFGNLPEELDTFVATMDWVKGKKATTTTGTDGMISDGSTGGEGSNEEEISSLWIMFDLGDVVEDIEEGEDYATTFFFISLESLGMCQD